MQKENLSRWQMISAMAIFGTIGPLTRLINLSAGELALYRAVLAVVFIGGFLLFKKESLSLPNSKHTLLLLLLSGAALGINWIFLFEAYRYTSVSSAVLSYYFAPVLVMLVCPILFREQLSRKQILCFIMATAGLVLMTVSSDLSGSNLLGIGLALTAAVFYAAVILLNKYIRGIPGLQRSGLQFLAAIGVLLPYVLFSGGFAVTGLNATGWLCLLVVGFVHTGIAYCLYFSSLKTLPGQKAAILSYIDPLVAVVLSATALQEPIRSWQLVGGLLLLGFTLLNELDIPFHKNKSQ